MNGHDEIRAMLGPFLGSAERVAWEVLEQVESGDVVMNERVDRFWLPGDHKVELRVAGVFKVEGGKVDALARLLRPRRVHRPDARLSCAAFADAPLLMRPSP